MDTLVFSVKKIIPDVGVRGSYALNGVTQGQWFVSYDQFGLFPYSFDTPYFLEKYHSARLGDTFHLVTSQKSDFNDRMFLIHVGNKHSDSKGCVIVGQTADFNDKFLYLSRHTFKMLESSIKDPYNVMVKFHGRDE